MARVGIILTTKILAIVGQERVGYDRITREVKGGGQSYDQRHETMHDL